MEVEDGAATSQKGCSVALPEGASSLPLRVHASGESGIPRFPITPRPQALAGEVSKAASKPRRPAPWPLKPKPRVPGRARGRPRTCGVGRWGTEAQPAVRTPAGDDPEARPLVRTPAEEEPEALRAGREPAPGQATRGLGARSARSSCPRGASSEVSRRDPTPAPVPGATRSFLSGSLQGPGTGAIRSSRAPQPQWEIKSFSSQPPEERMGFERCFI